MPIILTSPMNQSLSGLTAAPMSGNRIPTAMPAMAPTTTWNQSWRIGDPNRDRMGRLVVEVVMAMLLMWRMRWSPAVNRSTGRRPVAGQR
jgi:hypothetical protein